MTLFLQIWLCCAVLTSVFVPLLEWAVSNYRGPEFTGWLMENMHKIRSPESTHYGKLALILALGWPIILIHYCRVASKGKTLLESWIDEEDEKVQSKREVEIADARGDPQTATWLKKRVEESVYHIRFVQFLKGARMTHVILRNDSDYALWRCSEAADVTKSPPIHIGPLDKLKVVADEDAVWTRLCHPAVDAAVRLKVLSGQRVAIVWAGTPIRARMVAMPTEGQARLSRHEDTASPASSDL